MAHGFTRHRSLAAAVVTLGLLLTAAPGPAALAGPASAGTVLEQRLSAGDGLPAPDRTGRDAEILRDFYADRSNRPLWIDGDRPSALAHRLMAALAGADREGLVPADYGTARISSLLERGDSPAGLAELELLLTHGALNYARDLAAGRVEPMRVDPELFLERAEPAPLPLLRRLAEADDPGAFLASLAPTRIEYLRLRDALAEHRALALLGGWPAVPADETLRPGERQERVPALRRRLAVTGEYAETLPPVDPLVYDLPLADAVKRFQARHGLEVDGVVGANTLAELNVPVEDRIRQITLNMERWRWMPDDLGPAYLLVNLAGFTLDLVEAGVRTYGARVVVGTPVQRTPVFSDRMTYLEVNPTWTVPPSIARGELLPKLRKDPTYLARNGYTLHAGWSADAPALDSTAIDWSRVAPSGFGYKVVQQPGDGNALGRIKFMFPNRFDVYLHDTPSKRLFDRAERTFSHGCIRVQDPFALAERILALTGTAGWDRARLDAVKASGQRQVITLGAALPIHLTYITAFPDEAGDIQFRRDVYGRDGRLAAALQRSRTPWPTGEQEAAVPSPTGP